MKKSKYIIERSKLEPGDIILTSEKSWASVGIRIATLGKYSHAAIYVGKTIIEATLDGVFSKNPQRLLSDNKNQIAVFRSKKPLSEQEIKKICEYARSQTGTLYAVPEIIAYKPKSILKLKETKKQFCSRLVAKSYEAANYDLTNLRNPSFCTPKQLGLCKSFEQVEGIVRLATEEELEFSKKIDMNAEHLQHTYEWLNKARVLVSESYSTKEFDIQSINDVAEFLSKKTNFDSEISSFMKASGYLDHYNYDVKINQFRYNEELFLSVLNSHPEPEAFINEEIGKEPVMFNTYTQNLHGYVEYYKNNKLEFYRLHIQLYVNLITGIYVRLGFIASGCHSSGFSSVASGIMENRKIIARAIKLGNEALKQEVVV